MLASPHVVGPRARGVDDHVGVEDVALLVDAVRDPGAAEPAVGSIQVVHPHVVRHEGAVGVGASHRRQGQSGVVADRVEVDSPAFEPPALDVGLQAEQPPLAHDLVSSHVSEEREGVVQRQTGGELEPADPAAVVDREDEGLRANEMGSDPEEPAPLP